jgi:uncharacterized protein
VARKKSTPEPPPRLPIKLEPVSNGEFEPRPADARLGAIQRLAHERAAEHARRLGLSRRQFLGTSAGAATVLLAVNQLGCGNGKNGGRYVIPEAAAEDDAAARASLEGDELIFDVQTHHVTDERQWWDADRPTAANFLRNNAQADCGEDSWVQCFTRDMFLKEIFLDSDTHLGVLSTLYGTEDMNPMSTDDARITRERMAAMKGAPRLRIHGEVLPLVHSIDETRERMQKMAEDWDVAAWKLYPVWGPKGTGYRLDRGVGAEVIAHAVKLGRPLIAVHKGLPLAGMDPNYTRPFDVGPAAKKFPDATFLIYHSAWESDLREGPYNPEAGRGVDALIRTLEENRIGKDGNVYAELGSVWRSLMGKPDQAAHFIGKLLKHLGEDRILWGTDCIWYGSPQDQIQAFRTFEISEALQEKHGYPPLTPEARRKIFGLNAARVYGVDPAEARAAIQWDGPARAKGAYLHDPRPSFETRGPRNRREFLALHRANRGLP